MIAFDHDRWPAERLARLSRQERAQAMADVIHGRVQRVCKPGKWRVFREDGRVVAEDFTSPDTKITPA